MPLVLSGLALALVLGYVAAFGVDHGPQGDEGAAARLFQLIMLVQLAVVAAFAVQWLPRAGRPALLILGLQLVAAAIPVATVLILESAS